MTMPMPIVVLFPAKSRLDSQITGIMQHNSIPVCHENLRRDQTVGRHTVRRASTSAKLHTRRLCAQALSPYRARYVHTSLG